MQAFDNSFNNTRVDRNVSILYLILLMFLIYFLIILRLKRTATLLVIIMILWWLIQIKSAKISDLIFFSFLLMLVIFLLKDAKNLTEFVLLMGIITCFLDRPLIVILIHSFSFFDLLEVLWIFKIFLEESWENKSLILIISLMLAEDTWAYKHLLLLL